MEYQDVNNDPIRRGFYLETFYKGKDESRNRIIYIEVARIPGKKQDLFSVINSANIVKLNPNYSRWLKPFNQELTSIAFGIHKSYLEECESNHTKTSIEAALRDVKTALRDVKTALRDVQISFLKQKLEDAIEKKAFTCILLPYDPKLHNPKKPIEFLSLM